MQKVIFSVVCGIAGIFGLAITGYAQRPAEITREMIATALPVEGAPLAVPGPYQVIGGPAFGSSGHVVYRPSDLAPFPGKDTLPVVVWGNGGCAINCRAIAAYEPLLKLVPKPPRTMVRGLTRQASPTRGARLL